MTGVSLTFEEIRRACLGAQEPEAVGQLLGKLRPLSLEERVLSLLAVVPMTARDICWLTYQDNSVELHHAWRELKRLLEQGAVSQVERGEDLFFYAGETPDWEQAERLKNQQTQWHTHSQAVQS